MPPDLRDIDSSYEQLQRISCRPREAVDTEAFLRSLRELVHSAHASDRSKAVHLLRGLGEPERTKELIQFFDDCMWRETKLAVLRVLADSTSPRGLEFLISVASDDQDLGLARASIEALGLSDRPLAAHYLLARFESGDDPLLPYVVYALARLHCDSLRDKLLPTLQKAIEPDCQQPLLAQAIIFTLAEQRVHDATPLLLALCNRETLQRNVRLSALLALQRLAPHPVEVAALAGKFSETFFDQHLHASTLQQIELRRAVTLEDIVTKLAEPCLAEPSLASELDRFSVDDVRVGLEILWQTCPSAAKLSRILRYCYYGEAHRRYLDLLDSQLPVATLTSVLRDVEHHLDPIFGPALDRLLPTVLNHPSSGLFDAWCAAVVAALPDGTNWVLHELESRGDQLSTGHWLCAINRVTQRLIALRPRRAACAQGCARLARLLDMTDQVEVRGRLLRACGQLGYSEKRVRRHVEQALMDTRLRSSALVFLEQCPNQRTVHALTSIVDDLPVLENSPWSHKVLLLRTLAAQRRLPDDWPALDELLSRAIGGEWGPHVRVRALSLLAAHPRANLVPSILQLSRSNDLDHGVWVRLIVALKFLAPPEATSILTAWLRNVDGGVSESVRGRSLDALCALDSDEARRQVVMWLADNIDDVETCEKVIRSLTPPRAQRHLLAEQLGQLLEQYPEHVLHDSMAMLRDRILYDESPAQLQTVGPLQLRDVDARLQGSLPNYASLSEPIKAAIRGAELPYLHKNIYEGQVDKSVSVVGYCKAIDLILLDRLGRRHLFPALRRRLAAFQNVLFALGFQDEFPDVSEVHSKLHLGPGLRFDDLPLGKMLRICRSVYQGTIVQESWRVIDGLAAWAVVLLLFVRGKGTTRRGFFPILLPKATDSDIINLAASLLKLQAERNQAAHRTMIVEFVDVSRLRARALMVVRRLDTLFAEESERAT
jgi:hypothetical protein